MGGPINKLNDLAIKSAKPGTKPRRISDGGGLFLEIRPNGSKYWRLAHRFNKKQKLLAIGVYPRVSMQEARNRARAAKDHLADGRDPGLLCRIAKEVDTTETVSDFLPLLGFWIAREHS